jgi:serine/threonine protein phosphatase PrpC
MYEAKNTARALVRIGYDGRVHKLFRAKDAKERFENEVKVLGYLEKRGCDFVPRLLDADPEKLEIVTTNCGARVEQMSEERIRELFAELESYGVRHEDPFLRNITYRASDGRFCIIDFEFATIIDPTYSDDDASQTQAAQVTAAEPALRAQAIRWSAATDVGKVRPNNEDAFLAITFNTLEFHYLGRRGEIRLNGMDFVFAVSDGMGGENSGEFASRFAIDNITRVLPRRFTTTPGNYRAFFLEIFRELFHGIHRQLTTLGQSYAQGRNMGATLSLVWYVRGDLYFAHIGDSRIYYVPGDGAMRQITEDHTHVGWLRRAGKLNERQARTHPRKNVLSQALGAGSQFVNPQVDVMKCHPGDRLLLCTDGVIEGIWDHAIEDIVRQATWDAERGTPAEQLVREAIAESGRDNATALVVEIL